MSLLDTVLAEKLVVLFAKSGMGKTSLLNAGLMQPLRQRDFIPLTIRLNDSGIPEKIERMIFEHEILQKISAEEEKKNILRVYHADNNKENYLLIDNLRKEQEKSIQKILRDVGYRDPVHAFYTGLENAVTQNSVEYNPGDKSTLWHYFKTVEFWSSHDILLTPVLILDQFEEFFTLHSPNKRKSFITQFADLVRGRIPRDLLESLKPEEEIPYSETPPSVKVIISIREDFFSQLEEISRDLPDVMNNLFRLLALNRKQAEQAIVNPAKLPPNEQIKTKNFDYEREAIETMLDFLCKRKEGEESIPTNEAEPFQLQLLCHHIENTVQRKPEKEGGGIVVETQDLGGERGMQQVLEDFYDEQINRLEASEQEQEKVRKLCEEGLISATGRRRSLEEEDIEVRFEVSQTPLKALVDSHLLRAEPRIGSTYYELSHDTLVEPIRKSQKKREEAEIRRRDRARRARNLKIVGVSLILLATLSLLYRFWYVPWNLSREMNQAYTRGNEFYAQENYEEAQQYFQRAIELDPNFSEAYRRLGETLSKQGKYDEAIEQFEQAIELNPADSLAYRDLGDTYLLYLGMYDEAIEQYKTTIELNPQDADAYRGLGDAYSEQGRYVEAIEKYEKVIELKPQDADAYRGLGDVYFEQGNYIHAIEKYKEAITLNSGDADTYGGLGDAFFYLGRYDEAIGNYQKAIELNPNNASTHGGLGDALFYLGRYDEAIKNYKKAISLDPLNAGAYHEGLGDIFFEQGKYAEAINRYEEAIKLNPFNPEAYRMLGDSLSEQGRYEEAIEHYKNAIEINPRYVKTYTSLGDALQQQGQYDEAIEYYQKAIEMNPLYAEKAYKGLGDTFQKQGKYDEAIRHYKKALEITPKYFRARYHLAETHLMTGRFDAAFVLAHEVLQDQTVPIQPTLGMQFLSISVLFFQEKRSEAFDELKAFIASYKSLPENYKKNWEYERSKDFISAADTLPASDKTLLLTLIDILESPKPEADKKLAELEALLMEMF